jgi:4-diphosphocytidyl-2-C-methyl-D-erythritol kinase
LAELLESAVTCFAPAKINLALHITDQRSDGYHLLDSLVVFANIGDTITLKTSLNISKGTTDCQFDGPFGKQLEKTIAGKSDHLTLKATEAFQNSFGQFERCLSIHLEKRLPIASGIGGGSADAAATLLAMRKLYGGLPLSDLLAMSEKLGADVPMCLHSQALQAKGIGTDLNLVNHMPKLHLLLINPGIEISTPKIFETLESKKNAPLTPLPARLSFDNLIDWLAHQRNDLETSALGLAPQIGDVLAALHNTNASLARMSGSGATCFGIYRSTQASKAAAETIRKAQPHWWVETTETIDHGYDRALAP